VPGRRANRGGGFSHILSSTFLDITAFFEKIGCIVDYKPPVELKKLMVEDYERASAIAAKIGFRK
jgi:hypothetical protein